MLNIFRPIETSFLNKAPFWGNEWRGVKKRVSPLPMEQPKLLNQTNKSGKPFSRPIDIKQIRTDAVNYVNNLNK